MSYSNNVCIHGLGTCIHAYFVVKVSATVGKSLAVFVAVAERVAILSTVHLSLDAAVKLAVTLANVVLTLEYGGRI